MALVPWRGGDLERLRREMDRMFERFWGEAPAVREGLWEPELDVSETENEFIMRGEMPGIEPKDIDISLTGHTLTLKGEKKQERKEEGESYRFVERSYGSFCRMVELPVDVDPEHVKAAYKNGVLTVRLPKTEEARTKKIEVATT